MVESCLLMLPFNSTGLHPSAIEDFLPAAIHSIVRMDKSFLEKIIKDKCDELPDSDLVEYEEECVRYNSEMLFNEISKRLNESLSNDLKFELIERLKYMAVTTIEVKSPVLVYAELSQ